jgi:hypothetical protein
LEVDDYNVLIVCDPQGILGLQLRPRPIHLLNIIIVTLLLIKLLNYFTKLMTSYMEAETEIPWHPHASKKSSVLALANLDDMIQIEISQSGEVLSEEV